MIVTKLTGSSHPRTWEATVTHHGGGRKRKSLNRPIGIKRYERIIQELLILSS